MEEKRGRGKLRIMLLKTIKTNEIKHRALDRECLRKWIPRNCLKAEQS